MPAVQITRLFFLAVAFGFLFPTASFAQRLNSLRLSKHYASYDDVFKDYEKLKTKKVVKEGNLLRIGEGSLPLKTIDTNSLPSGLNSFVFSDNRDFFVAYSEAENETEYLYFYNSQGSMLSRQRVMIYPDVKYSHNGKFVIVFNRFGRQVLVFDVKGQLIFSADYIDMTKDKTQVLYNVLVSDNAEDIVINAGDEIHAFKTSDKQLIFKIKSERVHDGMFFLEKGKLIVNGYKSRDGISMKVISLTNGTVTDEVFDLTKIDWIDNGVIVNRKSVIERYEFK